MATNVDRVYIVTPDIGLYIRKGPGTSYANIGGKGKGQKVNCSQISDDGKWAYDKDKNGWLCLDYLKIDSYGPNDPETKAKEIEDNNETVPIEGTEEDIVNAYIESFEEYDKQLKNAFPVKSVKGILGMPYQFMKQTDCRLMDENKNDILTGRKYADRIMSKMPLLFITPGRPSFLKGFSTDTKKNVITKMGELFFHEKDSSPLSDLLNEENGRYYTFNMAYNEYYEYLNPLCQITARYLGIQDKQLFGTPLDKFDWATYTDPAFKTFISAKESIGFYVDSPTQISDSFSNSTGESMLKSTIDQGSDLAREISFILGSTAGVELDALKEENYDTTKQALDNIASSLNGFEVIKRLKSGLASVATGGKIIFPEIWNDSEFSRSYGIDIKLRTPYGDKLSWYLNILVPILHLIALTAPKQLDQNSYNAPFLVRAFYKGLFNVDMGIITSLDISKGSQSAWTVDGLPTEVDVSLQIKDLYSSLSLTPRNKIKKFVNNTCLMDYLANSCGVNINKPELLRSLDIYMNQVGITFTQWPNRVWRGFQESLSNSMLNIYNGIKF